MALRVKWKPTGSAQVDKLGKQFVSQVAVFARGGSYQKRLEKFGQYRRFLIFVAERFGPAGPHNIQPRHIAAYLHHRRQMVVEKTILDDLSVIRWWHRQIPWYRYEVPDNATLFELEARLNDKEFCAEIKNRYRTRNSRRGL